MRVASIRSVCTAARFKAGAQPRLAPSPRRFSSSRVLPVLRASPLNLRGSAAVCLREVARRHRGGPRRAWCASSRDAVVLDSTTTRPRVFQLEEVRPPATAKWNLRNLICERLRARQTARIPRGERSVNREQRFCVFRSSIREGAGGETSSGQSRRRLWRVA